MFFLLSGEGPTDLGQCCQGKDICIGVDYQHGPLAIFVDRLVMRRHRYSPLESGHIGFVSKSVHAKRVSEVKRSKSVSLPGSKRDKETLYFYNNARLLAKIAIEREKELRDTVIAILFRDSDGTASADRGLWRNQYEAIIAGFLTEKFSRGVAMLPKPKSEAWILCAVKNGYLHCHGLEERSGNDHSPNSLKAELESLLGQPATSTVLCEMIDDGKIDCLRLDMPSFSTFRKDLEGLL